MFLVYRPCAVLLLFGALLGGCTGNFAQSKISSLAADPNADDEPIAPPPEPTVMVLPFAASKPDTYVNRVKTLLLGSAATADEVARVRQNPRELRSLIEGWMQQPAYAAGMRTFFGNSFQQRQVEGQQLFLGSSPISQLGAPGQQLTANIRDSFVKTVEQIVASKQPFTETVTTRKFMMTVPMMVYLAAMDASSVSDRNVRSESVSTLAPLTLQKAAGMVPLEQTVNPASPLFLHFFNPNLPFTGNIATNCVATDPMTINNAPPHIRRLRYSMVYQICASLFGTPALINTDGLNIGCAIPTQNAASPYLVDSDFSSWKMVTVRQPAAGETTTRFYDLQKMRTTQELVLNTPRVGFFTTPSFLAQWDTNSSNEARSTMNQTLIGALGADVDGFDDTPPVSLDAVDMAHAGQPACYACHKTLDPMRQYFRSTYTFAFSPQTDPNQIRLKASYAFRNKRSAGTRIVDLAAALVDTPTYATAWTKKLCTYWTSTPCEETDPEVQRIAKVFADSNYDWETLVQELAVSPLITYAEATETATKQGQTFSIARRDQLCTMLSTRLGIADVCSLATGAVPANGTMRTVRYLAMALPSDQYSRGSINPVLVRQMGLFYNSAADKLCTALAAVVVGAGSSSRYATNALDVAFADMSQNLMGLTGQRADDAQALLKGHYASALAAKATPLNALQSTFVVACQAPSTVHIGL